jgi:voltage-gated potassium channel
MRSYAEWLLSVLSDRSLRVAVGLLIAITALGTAGYAGLEDLPLRDALYMTVITLSTVGYGEVVPLSSEGRWFTIGLITLGVGAALHAVGAISRFIIEGTLRDVLERRSMQRTIDTLRNHVIVIGYGRLGQAVCEGLKKKSVVVIDSERGAQARVEKAGAYFIHGNALEDNTLKRAGIEHADSIIAATGSDPDNVFIALSARDLRPDIRIHARAETPSGVRRLRLAGASQVISPHHLAGQRIANAILRPGVVEFLELSDPGTGAEVDLEEVVLAESSDVEGVAIGDLRARGLSLSVIALKRGDQPIQMHPTPDVILEHGDHLIAVGDRENLARLARAAQS